MDVRDAGDGADPGHRARAANRPADVAKDAEEHREHEDEPELGLEHAAVPARDPDDAVVVQRARDEHREYNAHDPAEVRQALCEETVSGRCDDRRPTYNL